MPVTEWQPAWLNPARAGLTAKLPEFDVATVELETEDDPVKTAKAVAMVEAVAVKEKDLPAAPRSFAVMDSVYPWGQVQVVRAGLGGGYWNVHASPE
ncbi:MAG TPA: hypothetical protein VIN56_04280 [Candidatus Dormibacteraeota bacterium]